MEETNLEGQGAAVPSARPGLGAVAAEGYEGTQIPGEGEVKPDGIPVAVIPPRWKRVRDYSNGSILDHIYRCESLEQLEALRQQVVQIAAEGGISRKVMRRIDRAGAAKYQEIESRMIVRPDVGGLLVPKQKAQPEFEPGTILLP